MVNYLSSPSHAFTMQTVRLHSVRTQYKLNHNNENLFVIVTMRADAMSYPHEKNVWESRRKIHRIEIYLN